MINHEEMTAHYWDLFKQIAVSNSALTTLRTQAMQVFAEQGFPDMRHEEWKYTNLSRFNSQVFSPFIKTKVAPQVDLSVDNANEYRLVFINGIFSPTESQLADLPSTVTIQDVATVLTQRPDTFVSYFADKNYQSAPLLALNAALFNNGAFIKIDDNAVLEKPIHLIFITDSASQDQGMSHYHNFIEVGSNAAMTLIESYRGFGDNHYFTTSVSDVALGANAHMEHYKLQQEGNSAFHVGYLIVQQQRNSQLTCFNVDTGGLIVRNQVAIGLAESGSSCTLNGFYLATGHQHIDNHTKIAHEQSHTHSEEFYQGIIDDRARAVFNGRVIVASNAQKITADQHNRNLLLSPHGEIDTKPQLEIYADDVKCTHGATVGQLDEEALFYLQARGLSMVSARALLTYGFAHEFVERIKLPAIRESVHNLLINRLPYGHELEELIV